MPLCRPPCARPRCLQNAHLQTIFSAVFRRSPQPDIEYHREMFAVSDGAQVALDWALPRAGTHSSTDPMATPRHSGTSPVVIILHGLTGGSQETCVGRPLSVHALCVSSTTCCLRCGNLGDSWARARNRFRLQRPWC